MPFGDEHILNYVTEFLQQAHSADERYTVRDGINIARFVMKLKSLDHGLTLSSQSDERFLMRTAILETLGDEALRYVRPIQDFEDPASLRRGNFTYFPVIPGRLEFAIELRRAILRERPTIVAVELPGSLEDVYLQTLARLPEMSVILYPDPNDEERAIYVPWSHAIRSPKPCAPRSKSTPR